MTAATTETPFAKPLVPKRDAGGDNTVRRSADGRPYVWFHCEACKRSGRIESEKRPGNTVQCKTCKGAGKIERTCSRTTSFIDVLDDKSNLMTWHGRMVLIGVALDPSLTEHALMWAEKLDDKDPEQVKIAKNFLNRRAESAKTKAGADDKADKGTYLHGLSELVDDELPLPDDVTFGDIIDMYAYAEATKHFRIVHMERLVVLDEFKVAGTPDRVSSWIGEDDLIAPDGDVIGRDELLITDLKTGSVEYGALKMAMQLGVYSRSKLLVDGSPERESMGPVNQKWGVIMHLPAGTGTCDLYWADLTLGWEAVQVAQTVRDLRNRGRKALLMFEGNTPAAAEVEAAA